MGSCNCAERERHDWFPMEAGAFLSSATVRDCAPWERQAFLYMLVTSWNDLGLPSDHKALGRMLGLPQGKVAELMEGAVGDKWEACPECGTLFNPKLEEARSETTERLDQKRANGKKGGKASAEKRRKAKQASSTTQPVLDHHSSTTQPVVKHHLEGAQANPTTLHNTTLQETNSLPSGVSEGRALTHDGSPVPQKNLETAIAKCLEPLPPPVLAELREFAVHVGERTGQSRGESYWRGVIQQLWKKPERALDRLAFSRAKDAKNLLDPTDDELAKFRGEDGKERKQFLTGRAAVQQANQTAGENFIAQAKARRAALAPGMPPERNAMEILGIDSHMPPNAGEAI